MEDWIEVELIQIIAQHKSDQQFVRLKDKGGDRSFTIVIGFQEIAEISRKLEGEQTPRPLTHDLIGRLLEAVGMVLEFILVDTLVEGTFHAKLVLQPKDGGDQIWVDCRPSDAIALAVQTRARMFVAREVFDEVAPV